jgi:hypothetical protein
MKKITENVAGLPNNAVLRLYAFLKNELRLRKFRNPVGDHAVQLIEWYLGGKRMRPSNKGFDLLLPDGRRVEVKARCVMSYNGSRILASDIRCLQEKQFDLLAMVILHADLTVARAFLIPYSVVAGRAKYSAHSNAWKFYWSEDLLNLPGVRDITKALKAIEAEDADALHQYSLVLTA